MGEPLSLAWEELLKHLSVVVGLFGGWRVVREGLGSLLHLVIVHLRTFRAGQTLWDHTGIKADDCPPRVGVYSEISAF